MSPFVSSPPPKKPPVFDVLIVCDSFSTTDPF